MKTRTTKFLTLIAALGMLLAVDAQAQVKRRPANRPQSQSTARAIALHPIYDALGASEKELGPNRTWRSVNPRQRALLSFFNAARTDLAKFSKKELESVASRDVEKVNDWLRQHGSGIRLDPRADLAMAASLKTDIFWEFRGTESEIEDERGKIYPAVKMNKGFEVFHVVGHKYHLIKLETATGEEFYLTIMAAADIPADDFAFFEKLANIAAMARTKEDVSVLYFPMVKVEQMAKLDWIVGLNTTGSDGNPAVLSEAFQETRFRMDEIGASVESTFAAGAERGLDFRKKVYVVDQPFAVLVRRPGMKLPMFAGWMPTSSWKDPRK